MGTMRGGPDGNERLTATAGAVLFLLLAAEGVTILSIGQLLSPHVFIGMLLIPPVALKLGSTGWRFARYYRGRREYREKGPPLLPLRLLAPVVVVSTVAVFATGIALLVRGPGQGFLLGLHKASFVVWLVSTSIHVLARLVRMSETLRARYPGLGLRLGLAAVTLAAGAGVATLTLPRADRLQDRMSARVGFDVR